MSIRIQLGHATVTALQLRLPQAYHKDAMRLVRRLTVLSEFLVEHVPVDTLHACWGVSPSTIYEWRKAFLLWGRESWSPATAAVDPRH